MRDLPSPNQPLSGIKKIAAFGAIGASSVAVVFWLLGPDWAFIAVLVLACSWARKGELLPVAAVAFYAAAHPVLEVVTRLTPHTYDGVLWAFENRVGFSPSAVVMGTVKTSPILAEVSSFTYRLGLIAAWVLAAYAGRNPWRFAGKVLAAGLAAFPVYYFLPACGPRYFLYGPANAPRNAIPSMHMVWALMVRGRVQARGVGARAAADIFIILTVLATLGLGEHYLVDLLAAIPFWLAFEALWMGFPMRRLRGLFGLEVESNGLRG